MKSFAGTEELQASFRSIGLALVRAEDSYFWFGNLGRIAENPDDLPRVFDYLKQELVGIKTGDLELYLEELRSLTGKRDPEPDYLCLAAGEPAGGIVGWIGWICCRFRGAVRRRRMFEDAIDREIRRRHGESDEGDTPIPAGLPLRVSSAVK